MVSGRHVTISQLIRGIHLVTHTGYSASAWVNRPRRREWRSRECCEDRLTGPYFYGLACNWPNTHGTLLIEIALYDYHLFPAASNLNIRSIIALDCTFCFQCELSQQLTPVLCNVQSLLNAISSEHSLLGFFRGGHFGRM